MRYRAFRRKKDDFFYFQFISEDDVVLLNSQSYRDKNSCFNGIRSVLNNAGNAVNYDRRVDGNGNHYFVIKAVNGQEIGQSRKYPSAEELETAIDQFIAEGPASTSKLPELAKAPEVSKADTEKPATTPQDQYLLSQPSSSGEAGFEAFRNEENESYYFHYNDIEGKVLLFSQAYSSTSGRNNGMESVRKNASKENRYQSKEDDKGFYFSIKAGNNQEIARSRYFNNEAAMELAIDWLRSSLKPSAEKDPAPDTEKLASTPQPVSAQSENARIYKDYKPLAFYEDHISGLDFGYDNFEADDKFYFTVNYEGRPLLLSEDYTSAEGRDNGIKSVKKNCKLKKRYERMVHPIGVHYFNLLAGNNQEIATSRWYETAEDVEKAIEWLYTTGGRRRSKKRKKVKTSQERIYLHQGEAALANNITYDTFQSGGNQRYYFVFKDTEGKAILINNNVRGFETKKELKKAVKEVIDFAPLSDQYEEKTTKNGKYYFALKNKEGKAIAKSSLFYAKEADRKAVLGLLHSSGADTPTTETPAKKGSDDYLPCEAYNGPAGFHTFQNEADKNFYFAYNYEGKTQLRSEGYKSSKSRNNGIQSVIKNAPLEKRWKTLSTDGSYYYTLRAGNNQEIARSCPYKDEAAMLAALGWIQGDDSPIGFGSSVVGGALLSAAILKAQSGEGLPEYVSSDETLKEPEVIEDEIAETVISDGEADQGEMSEEAQPEEETSLTEAALAAGAAGLILSGETEETSIDEEAAKAAEEARIAAEVEADKLKAKEAAELAAAEANRIKEEEEAALAAVALAAANRKAEEEVRLFEAEKQKKAAAAAAVLAASKVDASAGTGITQQRDDSRKKGGGWLSWLIPLILGLLIIMALLYFMRGCEGCFGAGGADDDTKTEISDGNGQPSGGIGGDDDSNNGQNADGTSKDGLNAADGTSGDGTGTPDSFGKNGKALGFAAGSMEAEMADFLSKGGGSGQGGSASKTFWADKVKFNKNNDRLRAAARKQLDNLAVLLKEYPDASIDIYGYINDTEYISFKGSKEMTLDDARSKAVFNYLLSRGIDTNRMDFIGNGLNDEGGIEIKLK